jgi:hypothetical protein
VETAIDNVRLLARGHGEPPLDGAGPGREICRSEFSVRRGLCVSVLEHIREPNAAMRGLLVQSSVPAHLGCFVLRRPDVNS